MNTNKKIIIDGVKNHVDSNIHVTYHIEDSKIDPANLDEAIDKILDSYFEDVAPLPERCYLEDGNLILIDFISIDKDIKEIYGDQVKILNICMKIPLKWSKQSMIRTFDVDGRKIWER